VYVVLFSGEDIVAVLIWWSCMVLSGLSWSLVAVAFVYLWYLLRTSRTFNVMHFLIAGLSHHGCMAQSKYDLTSLVSHIRTCLSHAPFHESPSVETPKGQKLLAG
jgi:hypothetical protein